jgi:hypothetical protein
VIVEVIDAKVGSAFRLDVDSHRARDAFEHPYAYAAFSDVDYAEPDRSTLSRLAA